MKELISILSSYSPKMPFYMVYMLQQVDYNPGQFIGWLSRFPDLRKVMYRKSLDFTLRAKLLLGQAYIVWILVVGYGLYAAFTQEILFRALYIALIFIPLLPLCVIAVTILSVMIARLLVVRPLETKRVMQGERLFKIHPAIKIAIAGSYGKTTMKELLAVVLSSHFKVAATPGNMNTAIAHAGFIARCDGDEDVLILEFGEGAPGDIARFASNTHPDYGIITGLAPNHLDAYKTLTALTHDIFSLKNFIELKKIIVSEESELTKKAITAGMRKFSSNKALDWNISNIEISMGGTSFTMKRDRQTLTIRSGLLGAHQVAPLALSAALAMELGVSKQQIEYAISKTIPHEHRMQPVIIGGAHVIDDTYNGNIEGIKAGLAFLSTVNGRRKIYVTPGLVEQGAETESVHKEMADLIAKTCPDITILMQNSSTEIIRSRLHDTGYKGEVRMEQDPLGFYQNIEHFVAAGDIVLMQNDWTDNYN